MISLDEKIKKVMYTLTIHYQGKHDFWTKKGFKRLHKKDKNFLFNYWKKKAASGDSDLLEKIDLFYTQHLKAELNFLQRHKTKPTLQEKTEPPSILDMAKNVTKAAGNFIKKGMKLVSEEQLQERLNICRSCDKFDAAALKGTGRCKLCGCSTAIKLKMATESCPISKWKALV